jgi:hypothetical protein
VVDVLHHPTSAVDVGSIVISPWARMCVRQAPIHSTCCSIGTTMFDNTDRLRTGDGEKFGTPLVIRPRWCGAHRPIWRQKRKAVPSADVHNDRAVSASKPVA